MRCQTLAALAATCLAQGGLATVVLGTQKSSTGFKSYTASVAWIDGIVNNMCQAWPDAFATISYAQDPNPVPNPCGKHFTLDNGHTYYLAYCGTSDIQLFNGDGSFNSHCHSQEQQLCTGSLWQTYKCY